MIPVREFGDGGFLYNNPLLSEKGVSLQLKFTPGDFDSDQIDANGCVIPGIPLQYDGTEAVPVLDADATPVAYGVVTEAVKVADSNATADLSAAPDTFVAVCPSGILSKALIEENLDRSLSAKEETAINDSKLLLLHG